MKPPATKAIFAIDEAQVRLTEETILAPQCVLHLMLSLLLDASRMGRDARKAVIIFTQPGTNPCRRTLGVDDCLSKLASIAGTAIRPEKALNEPDCYESAEEHRCAVHKENKC